MDSPIVDFQITLSTYKLNSQNKKLYILNKNTGFFFYFFLKKKPHQLRKARLMRPITYFPFYQGNGNEKRLNYRIQFILFF